VRSGLEDKYRTQQAQRQFSELADSFTNIVFEQSDSLKPAADQLKLTIQTATVSNPPAQGTTGLLANPKLLQAVFSVSARDKKQNTEAITLNATQLVSARVVSYTPAHAQAFADVQNQVRTAYIAEQSALLARESGQQQLKAWQAAPASATQLPAAITLSRQDPQKQPTPVVEAVLRADPTKLPVFVGVDLGAGGYAIAQVESVVPWNVTDKAKSDELLERYKQIWNSAQEQSYMNYLKTTYNAKILTPKPVGADLLAALQQQAQ
jgi:peptidyl-prolyl cis-trans isomerase D